MTTTTNAGPLTGYRVIELGQLLAGPFAGCMLGYFGATLRVEPDADGAGKKLEEEWGELKEAVAQGDQDAIESEMGDFLFSAVNYSRKLGVNAEDSTRSAISRFISRFHHIESTLRDRGISPEEVPLNELDKLWNEAKSAETQDLE